MAEEYRPRIAIDLTEEQKRRLDKALPWGTKTTVFSIFVEELLRLCDEHGAGLIIGAFLDRRIRLEELCKLNLRR